MGHPDATGAISPSQENFSRQCFPHRGGHIEKKMKKQNIYHLAGSSYFVPSMYQWDSIEVYTVAVEQADGIWKNPGEER